jgi:hypothetical protein
LSRVVGTCIASLDFSLERKPSKFGRSAHHEREANTKGQAVMGTILLIILILLLLGAVPVWPHSRGWGYYPGGGIGLILIIVLILVLMGRI